jgi:hypothetical protein
LGALHLKAISQLTGEAGDRLGRIFGFEIRVGRTDADAHGDNARDKKKNSDGR